jgi:hypothetical protein
MRAVLRPFAFALGGAVPIAVLLSLILFQQPASVIGYVIRAAGVGVVCWLGVLLGNGLWRRRQGRNLSDRKQLLFIAVALLVYALLGAVDVRVGVGYITLNLVTPAIAGAALLHGLAVGFNERPSAAMGAATGIWHNVLLAAFFGVGAGIVFFTSPPPTCPQGGRCFHISPTLSFAIGFLVILAVGFAVGLAMSGATGIGLLLCPMKRYHPEYSGAEA